jgi:DNA-directed RNA polymerase subunit alpha
VKRLEVDFKGPGVLKASDLVLPPREVVNKDLEIAHLNKEGHLKMTIYAANGRGYVTSEANKIERKINTIGVISTDSNYSPVVKVAYGVEPTRVEHDSKFDKLTLEVTTNGSVKPHEAVAMAAQLLVAHFTEFTKLDDVVKSYNSSKKKSRPKRISTRI